MKKVRFRPTRCLSALLILLLLFGMQATSFASNTAVANGTATTEKVVPSEGQLNDTTLTDFSTQEEEILLDLHRLQLEIASLDQEILLISDDIKQSLVEKEILSDRINNTKAEIDRSKAILSSVLLSYQKSGAGSQLENLLSSASLSDFLHRLSIFYEMNLQTSALLQSLEAQVARLSEENKLQEKLLTNLELKKSEKEERLSGKKEVEQSLSQKLSDLKTDREKYEVALAALQQQWDAAVALFPKMTEAFTRIVSEGQFTEDSLQMSFGLFGVTATLMEGTFQGILNNDKRWPGGMFRFEKDHVGLDIKNLSLQLDGTFEIVNETTLSYRVLSGTQGGVVLTDTQLAQLSGKGGLLFHLEPLLQGGSITRVNEEKGAVVLSIAISLF